MREENKTDRRRKYGCKRERSRIYITVRVIVIPEKKKKETLRQCKTGLIELSNGYDYISLLYTILVRFDTRI